MMANATCENVIFSTVGKNTEADNQIRITINYLLSLRSNK